MLRKVLEGLSVDTWERLRDAKTFDVRFGEETITDLLLLDLKRKAFQTTSVIQTSKYEEKNTGTDWEWWLGHSGKWLRLAIRAKKLKRNERYDSLGHKVSTKRQIDLLDSYAAANNALPMYCFYNHTSPNPSSGQLAVLRVIRSQSAGWYIDCISCDSGRAQGAWPLQLHLGS
jgi:hypothetical protein